MSSWTRRDAAFWLAFAAYTLGGLFVLGQGLVAVVASAVPSVHEALHVQALGAGPLARVALRVADAAHTVPSGVQIAADALFSLAHLAMAAALLWLRPRDRSARLLAAALVGAAGVFNLTAQAVMEQLPLTAIEGLLQAGAHTVAGLAYVYALLLFPDGRPVPHWRRRALVPLYLVVTIVAVDLSVQVEGPARPATLLLFFGVLVPVIGAAAQGYRIRHTADATGQAQARLVFWAMLPAVAFGVAFVALHGLGTTTNVFAGRHLPEAPVTLYRFFQPAFAVIPLALFAGLLRFRLWDIERLLSRTIVYASATGLLGGVYLVFVVTLQQVLGRVAASPLVEGRLAVAVTTLVLASMFRPVRDRVQRFVDHRFHRSRYDAQVTAERFARQLRDQVDIDRITEALSEVLDEVIEPERSWLWLRGDVDGHPSTTLTEQHPPEPQRSPRPASRGSRSPRRGGSASGSGGSGR